MGTWVWAQPMENWGQRETALSSHPAWSRVSLLISLWCTLQDASYRWILLSLLPACCHRRAGVVDEHPHVQVLPCVPWLNLGYQACAASVLTIWAPPCSDLFLPTPLLFFCHCTCTRWLSVCRVWKSLCCSHPTSSFRGSSFRLNIISRARTPCSCESDSVCKEEEKWVIKISYKIIQRIVIIVTF